MKTRLPHKPEEPVSDPNKPAFDGAVSLHNRGIDRAQLRPEIDQWTDDDECQQKVGQDGVGAFVIRSFWRWERVDIPMAFRPDRKPSVAPKRDAVGGRGLLRGPRAAHSIRVSPKPPEN